MRAVLLVCVAFVLAAPAFAQDADLATLVQQHVRGSDQARLKVIDAGLPAVPALVDVIRNETGRPANRAARAIGWIAEFTGRDRETRPRAEWTLVNLLVDNEQPILVRKTAARYMWHVASDDAVSVLGRFVGHEEIGTEARWSLENIPGAKALGALTTAYGSAKGDVRIVILETIGRRPDAPIDLLTDAARDKRAPRVRVAALRALGSKTDLSVAAFLAERVEKTEEDERSEALLAYLSVGDGLLASGDRDAARRIYEKALGTAGDVHPVVVRSLEGLKKSGNAESAQVIKRFLNRSNHSVQVAAAGALARLPGKAATTILAGALDGATMRKARPILSALIDRADSAAVDAVIPLARVDNVDVRMMALTALGRMGDRAACEVILEAHQDKNTTDQVRKIAFDAYVAVAAAQVAQGRTERARSIFESALQMANTDEQKVAALTGLAQVASPQSLLAIEPSLSAVGPVQDAAVAAYMAGADAVARAGERRQAIDALLRALDAVGESTRAIDIVKRLGALGSSVDVGSRNGYVTHWWVIGPFPSDENYNGTDEVFFPEETIELAGEHAFGDRKMAWRHQHSLHSQGIMDYVPMYRKNTNALCYGYAEVKLDQAVDARLHCGSDDSVVVWINGKEVHRFKGPRGLKVGEDKKDIRLRAGTNKILIKVVQGAGDWSSSIQLTDRNDQPLSFEQKTE